MGERTSSSNDGFSITFVIDEPESKLSEANVINDSHKDYKLTLFLPNGSAVFEQMYLAGQTISKLLTGLERLAMITIDHRGAAKTVFSYSLVSL